MAATFARLENVNNEPEAVYCWSSKISFAHDPSEASWKGDHRRRQIQDVSTDPIYLAIDGGGHSSPKAQIRKSLVLHTINAHVILATLPLSTTLLLSAQSSILH